MDISSPETENTWKDSLALVGVLACCVVLKDGKYLLVQEKLPKVYGLWSIPAVYTNKYETIEQAAIRGVKEETGYTVTLAQKVAVYHLSAKDSVKHAFNAHVSGGLLQAQSEEIIGAQWLSYYEIEALNMNGKLVGPWVWDAIRKVEAL